MPLENITAMILFHFCTICEVENASNAIALKILSDDKLCEVYTTYNFITDSWSQSY